MRTLIVDNRDSFTYNLLQALAGINGIAPDVVRNDVPAVEVDLARYHNVVVSPGPGHPGNDRDFGLSREVLRRARQPLLGVCLGHQGLCLLAGATVAHAPQVCHGRVSAVHHDGTDLFAGLPSPLSVVRYHSLAVTDLPPELEPTAWTADGVLMGVRDRRRPAWGVQFHPESIRTEGGERLLTNFAELTRRWWAARDTPIEVRGSVAVEPPAASVAPKFRVLVDRMDGAEVHAEQVFDALYATAPNAFWLDSAVPSGGLGRLSVLGDASGPLARVATADVTTGEVRVTDASGAHTHRSGFFDWLDADLAAYRVEPPDLPFEFALGWVGYLGYELKAECGAAAAHRSPDPDASMVFADRAVVFDHVTGEVYLLALVPAHENPDCPVTAAARRWLAGTHLRLAGMVRTPVPPGRVLHRPGSEVRLRHDRDAYLDLIARCHQAIDDGESYELCLTNQVHTTAEVDPWPAYRFLRRVSPAPFGAFLRFGALCVLSTSPERFLSVSAAGAVESRPIKGTRPRGATPEEDELLRADLAIDEKDQAENLMIVDLVRNDLGRSAVVGSVHVPALFAVETFASVHQLVSVVRAELRPDVSTVECVRAAFPGGSMTGAPKLRSMEILDQLEGGPRGVYSGAIGWFSPTGAADLSIVIRTLVVRPGEACFGVGGAVIALSEPRAEYTETAVKASAMLAVLGAQFPEHAPAPG